MDKFVKLSAALAIVDMTIYACRVYNDLMISVECNKEIGHVANIQGNYFIEIQDDKLFWGNGFWYIEKPNDIMHAVRVKYRGESIKYKKLKNLIELSQTGAQGSQVFQTTIHNTKEEPSVTITKEMLESATGITVEKQLKKLYRHSHFGAFPKFNPGFELYRYTLTDPSIELTKLSTVLGLENISVILKAPHTPELNAKKIAWMADNKHRVSMVLENERVFSLEKDCLFWDTVTESWFLLSETYKKVDADVQRAVGKEKFDMDYAAMVDALLMQSRPAKMPHSNIVRTGLDLRDILDSQLQAVIGAVKPTSGNTIVAVKEVSRGAHLLIFNSTGVFPIYSCELSQDTNNGDLLLDCGPDARVPVSIYLNGTPVSGREVETLIQDAKWARTSAPSNHEQRRRSWGSNAFLTECHKGETMETPAPQITRSEKSETPTTTSVQLSEALTLAGLKVTVGAGEELQRLLKELKTDDDIASMYTMSTLYLLNEDGLGTLTRQLMDKLSQMVDGETSIRVTNQFNKREDWLRFDEVSKVTRVVKKKNGVTTHNEITVTIPEALGKNTNRVVWVVVGVDFVNKYLVLKQDITKETILAYWD